MTAPRSRHGVRVAFGDAGDTAPAGAAALPCCSGLAFLERLVELVPAAEAATLRNVIERAESGESLEAALGFPTDWRKRERIRLLEIIPLSPERIVEELGKGQRSAFAAIVARIDRLSRRDPERPAKPLSASQIRRLT
jgi:hypothetical protein